MPEITKTYNVLASVDDDFVTIFQNRNANFSAIRIDVGKDSKYGLDNYLYFRFSSLDIPKGANITSAFMTVVCNASAGQSPTTYPVYLIAKDGKWNVATRTGWTAAIHQDFWFRVRNTSVATIANYEPAQTEGTYWELKNVVTPARRQLLGQSFTVGTTGNLGSIMVQLLRVGSPGGTMTMKVYSANADDTPNSLLATSDTVTTASLSTSLHQNTVFTFPAGQQPSLTSGTKYVMELSSSYSASTTAYVQMYYSATFEGAGAGYPSGKALSYGDGQGFDDQNYMSHANLTLETTGYGIFFHVDWSPPNFVMGTAYDTAGFSNLLQAWVDDAAYAENDYLCVQIQSGNNEIADIRAISPYENGIGHAVPKLTVKYIPPPLVHKSTVFISN